MDEKERAKLKRAKERAEIGAKYEKYFADFLDTNEVPYLHIEQKREKETCKSETSCPHEDECPDIGCMARTNPTKILMPKSLEEAKRPDFLVLFSSIGQIFIDVKARNLDKNIYRLSNKAEPYFGLGEHEIEYLYKLETFLKLPVWIAFAKIDENVITPDFYFVHISILKKYTDYLNEEFKNIGINNNDIREHKRYGHLIVCIPFSFCNKLTNGQMNMLLISDDKLISSQAKADAPLYKQIN